MFETICDLIPRDNDYAPRTRTLGILRRFTMSCHISFTKNGAPAVTTFRCVTGGPRFVTRYAEWWSRIAFHCSSVKATFPP
jgi:hypothetical protein